VRETEQWRELMAMRRAWLSDLESDPRRKSLAAIEDARAHKRMVQTVAAYAGDRAPSTFRVDASGEYLTMDGPVWGLYRQVEAALKSYRGEEIRLRIHSPGGDALEGAAVHNLLAMDGRPVHTVAMGLVASAAVDIFLAGKTREMGAKSALMIHHVWTCAIGDAEELRRSADACAELSQATAELYASVGRHDAAWYLRQMGRETYMRGRTAVESGLATGLVDMERERREAAKAAAKPAAGAAPESMDDGGEEEESAGVDAAAKKSCRLSALRGETRAGQAGSDTDPGTRAGEEIET